MLTVVRPGDGTTETRSAAPREVTATLVASFVSLAGDQLARLAMAVLVLDRTHSAALSALAYALTMVPAVVGGPLLGGLADRVPRRRLMVGADLARGLLIVVPALPGCPLPIGLGVVALVAFLEAGFDAARAALVADLAGSRYLRVLGWDRIVNQSAQLLGFAIGGALVVAVGARGALVVDAGTFLGSAVVLLMFVRFRAASTSRSRAGALRTAVQDALAGARHVVSTPARRRPLVLTCVVAAAAVLPEGLAAAYARELHRGGGTAAVLMLANPAGTIGSALWLTRRSASHHRVLGWVAVATAPLLLLAAAPPLQVVVPLLVVSGAGMSVSLITRAQFTAAVAPHMRGRAFAFAGAALTVAQGCAISLGGVVAQALGSVHVTLAGAAAGALACVAALSRTSRRRERDDPFAHRERHRLELRVRAQLGEN